MRACKILLIASLASRSMLATALPVCGFDIPDEETLHLQKDGGCSVSIQNKINYAQLDYLFFYKNKSIDKLLSDDLFFFKEEEKYYFVNVESLQWWADAGLGESNVWHFHPFGFVRHFRKCVWLSHNQLTKAFPKTAMRLKNGQWVSEPVHPDHGEVRLHRISLNRAMRKFGIATRQRAAAFLGNAMQETRWFRALASEDGGDTARYAPWFGRGFLQLTWPGNYIAYFRFRGHQVDDALAKQIDAAAKSSDRTRSNGALVAADRNVSMSMKQWRDGVGARDAADSAGAYWSWSGAATFADMPMVMHREVNAVGGANRAYYRCDSFGQVAATVNLGHPSNRLGGVNGLVARYEAHASAVVLLGDGVPFPDAQGNLRNSPDE